MTNRTGVLPTQRLQELFESGNISGFKGEDYLNPASIDLPLSEEAYRLESIFLPLRGQHVRSIFNEVGATKHDLSNPLEVGQPYLIRVAGDWRLPSMVYGYANPKSSTGRLNLFSRIVADNVDLYDGLIGNGWTGEMWVLVRADSFPVLLSPGLAVSQARLFDGKSFLDELHMELALEKHGLLFDERKQRLSSKDVRQHRDSMILTLNVTEEFGWECRGSRKVLDYGKEDYYNPSDFSFEKIEASCGRFTLRKDGFYILSTSERIMVPPNLSAELRAIDPRFGEFRSHAAGYIDSGWGWGSDGKECGRPITLEVTPREDMFVRHGQAIARVRYEHMKEPPLVPYDSAESNYKEQKGPQLSKHFKKAS